VSSWVRSAPLGTSWSGRSLTSTVGPTAYVFAAPALLIATRLAKPGAPLIGLVLGLAVVITAGPLLGRTPFGRRARAAQQSDGQDVRVAGGFS